MKSKNLLLLVLCVFVLVTNAQEQWQAMHGNAVLMQAAKNKKHETQKAQATTAAFLPFADDFSYFGPYPDPARWENSTSVFVNHTKAVKPVTIGVATFDGLNRYGLPYNPAVSSGVYQSDTLTSIPLRLDSLNGLNIIPSDSVTLRFYYQPRGFWEKPDNSEDLMLDFYKPALGQWINVWSATANSSNLDSSFHRVMIPILDTSYLKNGFKFRFRNFSTACGDVDHWHVDAIYLDKKLNPARDTIVPEISFTYDAKSILKNYSQMPYWQFTGAPDMQSNFSEYYNLRNNYTTGVNLTTYYQINDNMGVNVAQNTNGTNNVSPFGSGGFCNNASLVDPSLNSFVYNNGVPFTDSTSYLLKFYATNTSDNYHANDTIYYRQKFHNYYAYDDGSAEAGYGVSQVGSNGGIVVVKYQLNSADTLRAVDIYFDPIQYVSQLSNSTFRIIVYGDNAGIPGAALYKDSLTVPYYDSAFNAFQRYQLTTPLPLAAGQTFYVGTLQTGTLSLNVGYDFNTDNHTKILFNLPNSGTPGWYVSSPFSQVGGSLMLHPVLGPADRAVGVTEPVTVNTKEKVLVYPNPASDEVFVTAKSPISKLELCDLLGNTLIEESSSRLNTSSLPSGMYLIKTFTSRGHCDVQKLLIAR